MAALPHHLDPADPSGLDEAPLPSLRHPQKANFLGYNNLRSLSLKSPPRVRLPASRLPPFALKPLLRSDTFASSAPRCRTCKLPVLRPTDSSPWLSVRSLLILLVRLWPVPLSLNCALLLLDRSTPLPKTLARVVDKKPARTRQAFLSRNVATGTQSPTSYSCRHHSGEPTAHPPRPRHSLRAGCDRSSQFVRCPQRLWHAGLPGQGRQKEVSERGRCRGRRRRSRIVSTRSIPYGGYVLYAVFVNPAESDSFFFPWCFCSYRRRPD